MSQNQEPKIPDDIADEVLKLAAELYAQTDTQGYSLAELQEIGGQVEIPAKIISEALIQIQEKYRQKEIAREKKAQLIQNFQLGSLFLVLVISLWAVITYNVLGNQQQDVMARWAQVENQLQRKADLIPTLISLTQAQTQREKELILSLENARNQYLQADDIDEKLASTENISNAITQFNEYALNDGNLGSSQAFINLQYEIAGTENRIATERMRYNQSVQRYNGSLKSFPNSIVAGLTGFEPKSFFRSQPN